MVQRGRLAMQQSAGSKLADDSTKPSFGKASNMHRAERARKITGTRGGTRGEVRVMDVDSRRKKELQGQVRDHVEAGAAIFSDEVK